MKPFLILSALVVTGVMAPFPQAPPAAAPPATVPAFKIPPEAASMVNPVKPTAESLARAKKIYGYECSACHGDDGAGAGEIAKSLKAKMPDFRDPAALKGRTDGELFYIIKNGEGEMDGEGQRVKPDDMWNLVNYVRAFSKS